MTNHSGDATNRGNAMSDIERFDIRCLAVNKRENGGWVRYDDHRAEVERLTAERDAAQAEVQRLITERDQTANRPKGREVGRVGLDYAYSNAIPPPRPTDEDIWREVFFRCVSEYITGEKRVIIADTMLAEYRKRWPR